MLTIGNEVTIIDDFVDITSVYKVIGKVTLGNNVIITEFCCYKKHPYFNAVVNGIFAKIKR